MTAVAHNLFSPLLKRENEMLPRRFPNVTPKCLLSFATTDTRGMLCANQQSPFIQYMLLTKSSRKILFAAA
ncbi:MAG: hypothetical protein DWI02_05190 [Planctomycetota bacterium]|nr:MAG: hypothetical protein DWI02_05190 [Planctomycetota bacterium]